MRARSALVPPTVHGQIEAFRVLFRELGLRDGLRVIRRAAWRHGLAIARGDGRYAEPGKRRWWLQLHFLKQLWDGLLEVSVDPALAMRQFEVICRAPSLAYIQGFVPPPERLTKSCVLERLWPGLVERDENVTATVDPPQGNSVSLRVSRCLLQEVARDVGLLPAAEVLCAADFAFWQDYHPNVRFSRSSTLMTGGDRCDHTLTWVD